MQEEEHFLRKVRLSSYITPNKISNATRIINPVNTAMTINANGTRRSYNKEFLGMRRTPREGLVRLGGSASDMRLNLLYQGCRLDDL